MKRSTPKTSGDDSDNRGGRTGEEDMAPFLASIFLPQNLLKRAISRLKNPKLCTAFRVSVIRPSTCMW